MPTSILWLRRDLRLGDNPALGAAARAADGGRVVALFVGDPVLLRASGNRRRALAEALTALTEATDGAVVYREGDPATVLPAVAEEAGATSVHISAEPSPYGRRRDAAVAVALGSVPLTATGSPYAVGPGLVRTAAGEPYQVFTPYSRAWREHGWPRPAEVPSGLRWHRQLDSEPLPSSQRSGQVRLPVVGEQAAHERWQEFLQDGLDGYGEDRDRPDLDGTSRLSVQLKYGTIHPRTLLADLAHRRGTGTDRFVAELAWREFYADVLWHRPDSLWSDLRPGLARMEYDDPAADPQVERAVAAWREGRTGFPIVDAGMRQLVQTGWMHNRVRMITASFLCKHLHVWWPHGARFFLEHLVDGDVASNNHGWQWVAGTGTDAAPYFRVFNPLSQGRRFDPDGDYVRRWVPELRQLSGDSAHRPWEAAAGAAPGYPEPILDLGEEREEALRRYSAARGS